MKKILSIVLTIALAVSCLAIFPSAATTEVMYENDAEPLGTMESVHYTVEATWNDDGTLTLTVHSDFVCTGTVIPTVSFCGYLVYHVADLEYIDGSYRVYGHDDETCIQGFELCDSEFNGFQTLATVSGGILKGTFTPNEVYRESISWDFNVLAEPGSEIVIWEDGFETANGMDCVYNGNEWFYGGDIIFTLTVPEAEEEPTYTTPAMPVATTKAACEACGTEAGVRFLMTVDKTAADFADVTAYGVVIDVNGAEYKYTADADTKKAETATEIQYAVVLTGAPADAAIIATPFFMYGDVEVAGTSGQLGA